MPDLNDPKGNARLVALWIIVGLLAVLVAIALRWLVMGGPLRQP